MSTRELVNAMSRAAGLRPEEVRGPRRWRELTRCRRAIALRMRAEGASWPEIGRALGRHHTSVMGLVGALPSKPQKRPRVLTVALAGKDA